MKYKHIFGGFGILIFIVGCSWFFLKTPFSESGKKIKYVAYIGRYTPPKDAKIKIPKFDLLHEVTLRSYVSKINLPDTKLELKSFSYRNDSKVSDSIYNVIANDPSIVAVIDNTWGEHIRNCSKTIKEKNI